MTTALEVIQREILLWEEKLARPFNTKAERNKAQRYLAELHLKAARYYEAKPLTVRMDKMPEDKPT